MNTSSRPLDNSFFIRGGPVGILLIHGLTGTPTEMRYLGKGLADSGHTVYGMQLAGHCAGESALLGTRWQDWVASVEAAYAALASEVEHVFVGGLSAGAVLALHLAAARPAALRGIVLLATTLKYDGWSMPVLRHFLPLLPLLIHTPLGRRGRFMESHPFGIKDERLRRRVVANMESGNSAAAGLAGFPWPSLNEFYKLVRIVKREMPSIDLPALIMHSDHDDTAGMSNVRYLQRHLAGPKKVVLLHDSYHMITVDRQRGEVVRHTAKFIRDLSVQAGHGEPIRTAIAYSR